MLDFPFHRVNWPTSIFLMGTLSATLIGVPLYLWQFGFPGWEHILMAIIFFGATGISITLGYHRLFAHRAFQAKWPIKLLTLVFGAASFENSAFDWVSDHRRHHKHVDHDDDPYNINKGFFWAHIGWLIFKVKPGPAKDNVADLQKDKLVMFQHKHWLWMGLLAGFVLPAVIGYFMGLSSGNQWTGALAGFLFSGVARVVAVQHCTFFINSLCHCVGGRPYSVRCSARDSSLLALFTFGEGYHNYHHEFQHDYRNGVGWWKFDPTKWSIWLMSKVGLTSKLRTVPKDKIEAAVIETREKVKQEA